MLILKYLYTTQSIDVLDFSSSSDSQRFTLMQDDVVNHRQLQHSWEPLSVGMLERNEIIFLYWEQESQTQKPTGARRMTKMREVVKKWGLLKCLCPTRRKFPLAKVFWQKM